MNSAQKVVLSLYAGLLLFCSLLIVGAASLGPYVQEMLTPVAVEALKNILFAFVGALSAVWGASK
ncbi:hypothetical protein TSA1_20370 [Bradyrhizobium nitroreducens]|uniref:Uncharacterized protein n=1 Tax=Bradyrhizobium nitroreducens TaxID=709803 RepID=A0A2M6UE53_9BRAD|nr:hypothetical protein [Bradyrhizobium nitroreducens]PIT02845.1 hypothetical protein TSA1_20370 [Bradyrhizobium nitroreducens]